jgi:hypothetical protein
MRKCPRPTPTMRISPPPAPPSDWLQRPHGIMQMLLDHQWTARQEVLKVLGFILYQLLQDQNWYSKIWTPSFIANVDCLQLLSSHRCGVIINPFSTSLQDIVNFVHHHVPVHYPWRKDNPINPPHFLDPYTFPTHRFNFWPITQWMQRPSQMLCSGVQCPRVPHKFPFLHGDHRNRNSALVFYVNILGSNRAERPLGTSAFRRFTMVICSGPMDFRSLLKTHITAETETKANTRH